MTALRLERTLTQAEFDAFARLSGDDNPIHVDADFSARSRFGRPVAHGVFLIAILDALARRLHPGARLVGQAIRFTAPTYAGEPMAFEAAPGDRPGQVGCRIVRLADGVVTCDGTLSFEVVG